MDARDLIHRITIQRDAGTTTDAHGQPVPDWKTFAERWAWIQPISGNERYINQQLVASLTHKIMLRYLAGVTAQMRVLFKGRVFEIVAPPVNWEERSIEMVLLCREVA